MLQGFWAKAVNTASYLDGLTPSSRLKGVNPDEAWSGAKKSIACLQTFGCATYAFVDKKYCNKIDSKTHKCQLLGYEPGVYRLWDPVGHKMIRHHNVVFDETTPFDKAAPEIDLSDFKYPLNPD